MGWRWIEPGPRGRRGYDEATRDAAIRSAVHNGLVSRGARPREIAPELVPGLWRSMERAGWRVEEVRE